MPPSVTGGTNSKPESSNRNANEYEALAPQSPRWVSLLIVSVLLILLIAGAALYLYSGSRRSQSNSLEISGRIEAPETHISAATATRVNSVLVREGDLVHKGQLLLSLDSQQIETRIHASRAMVPKLQAAQRAAAQQVAAVQQDINVAKKKSRGFWAKVFSTPSGRKEKENELRGRMMQAKMMQFQASEAIEKVHAAETTVASKMSYFNIASPVDGMVTTRSTEPGELVSRGQVLLTIIDPKQCYMRGFVPEGDISKIKIDQKAQVYLDGDQKHAFGARITAIDAKPSFTPEDVYFKDDRVRQVFGVKLLLDNTGGTAKPGMPADAEVVFSREK